MNKKTLFAGFITTMVISPVMSEQITININAKVTGTTCTVANSDFLVQMTPGSINGMTVGTPFGKTPFAINIDNCPANVTTAHVKFTGISDSDMPNLIQLDSTKAASAQGIALGLYNQNMQNIDIQNNNIDFTLNPSLNRNKLNFVVAYVKTLAESNQGKVSAVASFEISYD